MLSSDVYRDRICEVERCEMPHRHVGSKRLEKVGKLHHLLISYPLPFSENSVHRPHLLRFLAARPWFLKKKIVFSVLHNYIVCISNTVHIKKKLNDNQT